VSGAHQFLVCFLFVLPAKFVKDEEKHRMSARC